MSPNSSLVGWPKFSAKAGRPEAMRRPGGAVRTGRAVLVPTLPAQRSDDAGPRLRESECSRRAPAALGWASRTDRGRSRPHPPIWWAGKVRSIPRAARYAEYFVTFRPRFEEIRDHFVPLLAQENEKRRTRTKLACWVYCYVTPGRTLSGDEIDARFAGYYFADAPDLPRAVAVAGSPEQCAAKISEYRAAGVSRLVLDFQNHGIDSVEATLEQMAIFREEVVPVLG